MALLCILFCLIQTESFVCWDCVAEWKIVGWAWDGGGWRCEADFANAWSHAAWQQHTNPCLTERSITFTHTLFPNSRCARGKLLKHLVSPVFHFKYTRKRCSARLFNAMLQYCVSMRPGSGLSRCRLLQRPHPWHAHPFGAQPIGQSCWQTQPRVAPPSKRNHQSLHYRASLCSPWWVIF